MKRTQRLTATALATCFATATLSPIAMASDAQKQKNDWRNIGAGAAAAALLGLKNHDALVTVIGAAGAAYAGKKYEDERKAQAAEAARQARYHRTTNGTNYTNGYHRYVAPVHGSNPIRVDVNGNPVAFNGVQPMAVNGTVLVPLRGVFESLGATVDYDASNRTVIGSRGSRYVRLPLSSNTATINGNPVPLSEPARVVNGTTLVPLRFVAEALGSNVQWLQASNTVEISSNGSVASAPVDQPPINSVNNGSERISGTVASVSTDTDPMQVVVRSNGQNRVVSLTNNTIVLRGVSGQSATQVGLGQLNPGDSVTVTENANGVANNIVASYGVIHGSVASVGTLGNGRGIIVLNSGRTVELAPNAVIRRDGRVTSMSQVRSQDIVVIRTNPSDQLGYNVIARPNLNAHRR